VGFRQRSLHPFTRRVRDAVAGRFSARPPRSQRVYRVEIEGRPVKRVIFPDAHQASQVAARLRTFGAAALYPQLLLEREREVWVEFIEGEPLLRVDAPTVEALAHWLARLNKHAPRRVPRDDTHWLHALEVDLDFLRDVGVLEAGVADALRERARTLAPAHIWQGHDCTDFILKNFIRTPDGKVRAVDVESLGGEDELLGWGAAKGALRWLGDTRESFLGVLRADAVPDYLRDFEFVELAFVAFWTKSSFLEGKQRFVDAGHFRRFLAE
jgi:hypothetical protein